MVDGTVGAGGDAEDAVEDAGLEAMRSLLGLVGSTCGKNVVLVQLETAWTDNGPLGPAATMRGGRGDLKSRREGSS